MGKQQRTRVHSMQIGEINATVYVKNGDQGPEFELWLQKGEPHSDLPVVSGAFLAEDIGKLNELLDRSHAWMVSHSPKACLTASRDSSSGYSRA